MSLLTLIRASSVALPFLKPLWYLLNKPLSKNYDNNLYPLIYRCEVRAIGLLFLAFDASFPGLANGKINHIFPLNR